MGIVALHICMTVLGPQIPTIDEFSIFKEPRVVRRTDKALFEVSIEPTL
jgi:hypothetical protein